MRRGRAARVASLLYLTPVFAVVLELAMFGVLPSRLSVLGIVITLFGVALVVWRNQSPRTLPAGPRDDGSNPVHRTPQTPSRPRPR
jgi:drug/metabolite transporter (DMT)-like permease